MNNSYCIEWEKLNVAVVNTEYSFKYCRKETRTANILTNVSGCMESGDLVAVLGPSGSGKTTLIAAISQRLRGKVTGEVRVNGMIAKRKDMTKLSSFVPQFDITVSVLTPREHLYFMGELKMDRNWSMAKKNVRINELLWRLGLQHVADTRIDKMSGGERKKLNLATDLLTDPPILFCDEPTTGLDSFNAMNVIKSMKSLTQTFPLSEANTIIGKEEEGLSEVDMFMKTDRRHNVGKAIMCSIHHPTAELFEIFTHVILMYSGTIAFQGTLTEVQDFFLRQGFQCPVSYNPAEYYIQVITKEAPSNRSFRQAIDMARDGRQSIKIMSTKSLADDEIQRISWAAQVLLLMKRSIIQTRRTIWQYFIALCLLLVIAVAMAGLYINVSGRDQQSVQGVQGAFFIMTAEVIFGTSYGVAHSYPTHLPILRRETGENVYNLSAYYISKIICRIPGHMIDAFSFLGIIYMFAGFSNGWWLFIKFGLILTAAGVTASAYGCMISGFVESARLTSEIAPPFDLLFLILGGFYINLSSFSKLKFTSLFFFSNEALSVTYWHNISELGCPASYNGACFRNGTEVLQSYSYRTDYSDVWIDYLGMLMLSIIMHTVGYFGVRRLIRKTGFC